MSQLSSNGSYVLDYESVSPLGVGKLSHWIGIEEGQVAAGELKRISTVGLPVTVGAEIQDDLSGFLESEHDVIRECSVLDRKLELLATAANLATGRFSEFLDAVDSARKGIILGMGQDVTNVEKIKKNINRSVILKPSDAFRFLEELNNNATRVNMVMNPIDVSSIYLANKFGAAAFQKTIVTACAASSQALGYAARAIRRGKADIVLAGGADSLLNVFGIIAFTKLGVIQQPKGDPRWACRPLDKTRNGTLLGEGAGLVLLASGAAVEKNGWKPVAEIVGFGNSLDGYKITAPDPNGEGMRRALKEAAREADLQPGELDYINLHGTGTRANDSVELEAVDEILGSEESPIPVSSTKDRHGHLIGAAGVIEFNTTLGAMENGKMPGTINLRNPIEVPGLKLFSEAVCKAKLDTCATNSFAFGGVNTVIITKKVE